MITKLASVKCIKAIVRPGFFLLEIDDTCTVSARLMELELDSSVGYTRRRPRHVVFIESPSEDGNRIDVFARIRCCLQEYDIFLRPVLLGVLVSVADKILARPPKRLECDRCQAIITIYRRHYTSYVHDATTISSFLEHLQLVAGLVVSSFSRIGATCASI
jgi:hypothetical protein